MVLELLYLIGFWPKKIKGNIIRGPLEGAWAPGYFYILFEDPDKIRLEVNYVPNKGAFDEDTDFNPNGDY